LSDLKDFFQRRVDGFAAEWAATKKRINVVSALRLVSILLILPLIYFYATTANSIWLILSFIMIAAFIALVTWHQNLFEKKVFLENIKVLNEEEINALQQKFEHFPSGQEFVKPSHNYAYDLDIFGDNSIFQYLNRTCTASGKIRLSQILSTPLKDKNEILERQNMLQELDKKIDFRQEFQATGMSVSEDPKENQQLFKWFQEPPQFLNKGYLNILRFLLPAILFICIILAFFNTRFGSIAILLSIFNLIFVGLFTGKINLIHSRISTKNGVLNKYLQLLKIIQKEKFQHPQLAQMQSTGQESMDAIQQFSKIVNRFDQRLNLLVGILLNMLILNDIQSVIAIERWKAKHQTNIEQWLSVIFEIDALNSLANFSFCHPHFIYPEINNDLKQIDAYGIGHPLIPPDICILNNLSLGDKEKMIILTGANMSGKSTFLRTLGINTVLALIGAPVYAEKFSTPILEIMTSMRLTDSLKERASYFYAELKRLQSIVRSLESGTQLFIILDEILKGTNSEDKLSGSIALIKRFTNYNCLGIIATHDLELGKLEGQYPNKISNHCFESIIEEKKLSFDYTLKAGIAQNKNATFLMETMEII